MNDNNLLKENIFRRAKIFIEDMGHFAPFGAKLIGKTVKDIVIFDDSEEIVNGQKIVDNLKSNFEKEIKGKSINAGAIAYDVILNINNSDSMREKRDALCLIISSDGLEWTEEYYPYMLIDRQCVWR
jgi:hypothetical protein